MTSFPAGSTRPDDPSTGDPSSRSFCATARPCPLTSAANCPVYRRDKNCWEVEAAACCDRSRRDCRTCALYVGFLRAYTVCHAVKIWLSNGVQLGGLIYAPATERLSDYLNQADREFIVVTDARVQWSSEDPLEEDVGVLFLRASAVDMLLPLEEPPGPGSATG